ncbi:hypothetical protein BJX66DRAFT_288983 [Aspergillus keveii]|uniref:ABM domain-containing protein n=1 Tax=Aspergillus keveii TaxID=714993 RepID=A0ABR4GPY6_9EURO
MSEVHIVATFHPVVGKVDRMRDILRVQCATVHEREDYALRFMLTEEISAGDRPSFCLFETYTSTTTVEQHLQEPHFKAMLKTMEDEGLMASPPAVLKTTTVAGFDLDRELVL